MRPTPPEQSIGIRVGSRLVRQVAMTAALGATVAVAPVFAASLPAALETIGRFRWQLPPLVVAAALTN